jgi:DNA-binding MarR family transcriptional regulator
MQAQKRVRQLPRRPLIFDLSRYLPYLLNRAGVRIGMAFSEEVARHKITLPMWRILAQLWHEEYRCQTELAALTSTDPATLSRLLRSMEAKGMVSRQRPKENGREVRVMMTAKGRALTKRIIPLALQYEALAVNGIEPAQIELVKDVLTQMYDNIAAYHDQLLRQARPPNLLAKKRK